MNTEKSYQIYKKILLVLIVLGLTLSNSPQKVFANECSGNTPGTCPSGMTCAWKSDYPPFDDDGFYVCADDSWCTYCTDETYCRLWGNSGSLGSMDNACLPYVAECTPECSGSLEECTCVTGVGCSCQDADLEGGGGPPPPPPVTEIQLGEGFDITGLVTGIYGIVLPAAVVLGLILIVRAGYLLMTSQGDPRRVGEGKEGLTASLMGLLFVILSIAILRIVIGTFISGSDPGF